MKHRPLQMLCQRDRGPGLPRLHPGLIGKEPSFMGVCHASDNRSWSLSPLRAPGLLALRPLYPTRGSLSRGGTSGFLLRYKVYQISTVIKGDWRDFPGQRLSPTETDDIRKHAQTGRPLGDERFVTRLECLIGRELRPRKPGRKPKKSGN